MICPYKTPVTLKGYMQVLKMDGLLLLGFLFLSLCCFFRVWLRYSLNVCNGYFHFEQFCTLFWGFIVLGSLPPIPFLSSTSCRLHFRSRLCPLSCSSVRSCELSTWATTACRRCRHALENSQASPSWSWGGTVSSAFRWSSESVVCWRGAAWWWRKTCSTRCHQKWKSSFGGPIRNKHEERRRTRRTDREAEVFLNQG